MPHLIGSRHFRTGSRGFAFAPPAALHTRGLAQMWHSSVRVSRREAPAPGSAARALLYWPLWLVTLPPTAEPRARRDSSSRFHHYPPTKGTAPFPHGTRPLSVSNSYVSLGDEHHLFTVHYQPLLLSPAQHASGAAHGLQPSPPSFPGTHRAFRPHPSHNAKRLRDGTQPFRSPLLTPSHLLSFPSPTNMLKSGEYPRAAPDPGLRAPRPNRQVGGIAIRPPRLPNPVRPPRLSHSTAAFLAVRADGSTDRRSMFLPNIKYKFILYLYLYYYI